MRNLKMMEKIVCKKLKMKIKVKKYMNIFGKKKSASWILKIIEKNRKKVKKIIKRKMSTKK